jgi:hypothetical protein
MTTFIFFGIEFTQKVQQGTTKTVICEGCGASYSYWMSRTATGRECAPYGFGQKRAAQKAHDQAVNAVRRKLERQCDLVPCPSCGLYQSEMVRQARSQQRPWMRRVGSLLMLVAIGPFLLGILGTIAGNTVTYLFAVIFGCLAVLGAALWLGQKHLSNHCNPNDSDVEQRKQRGRMLACHGDGTNRQGGSQSPDGQFVVSISGTGTTYQEPRQPSGSIQLITAAPTAGSNRRASPITWIVAAVVLAILLILFIRTS